jgi:hypothetical protein
VKGDRILLLILDTGETEAQAAAWLNDCLAYARSKGFTTLTLEASYTRKPQAPTRTADDSFHGR